MPDLNGLEATRQILASNPKVKVIALSMHSAKRFVVEMLKAGSSGYLLKDCAFEELALAIHTVIANKVYVSPSINDIMIRVCASLVSEFSVTSPLLRNMALKLGQGKTTNAASSKKCETIETYPSRSYVN
jgi:DNA-binding NarL/FixJ family response regulator